MKQELIFQERQRFNQWWVILILIVINALFIYGCISQIGLGIPFGNKPASDHNLIISTSVLILITVFTCLMRLDTLYNKNGIYIRLFPIHPKFKFVPWENIEAYTVERYSPIVNFGGKAYNISGNKGIQLTLTNGRKLLVGTQKPEDLADFLKELHAERK